MNKHDEISEMLECWEADDEATIKRLVAERTKELTAEVERLEAEYVELLESAFKEIAYKIDDWWDSNGRATACDYGDRLVALGLWERHPCGVGRRQWYRPVKKEGE